MDGNHLAKLFKQWRTGKVPLTDNEVIELRGGLQTIHDFHIELGEGLQASALTYAIMSIDNIIHFRALNTRRSQHIHIDGNGIPSIV